MFGVSKEIKQIRNNGHGDVRDELKIVYETKQSPSEQELGIEWRNKIEQATTSTLKEMARAALNKNMERAKGRTLKQPSSARCSKQSEQTIVEKFSNMFSCATGTVLPRKATRIYDVQTTNAFLTYVLMMVLLMYMFTMLLNTYVLYTPDVNEVMHRFAINFSIVAVTIFLLVDLAFMFLGCARNGPCNFVCLCLTVISISWIIAIISVRFKTDLFLYMIAVNIATVIVCLSLSFFNFNFLSRGVYMVALAVTFTMIASITIILYLVTREFKFWFFVALSLGSVFQVVLFIMQLTSIVSGSRMHLKDDDYALGAFMLYASLFDIFIKATCFRRHH